MGIINTVAKVLGIKDNTPDDSVKGYNMTEEFVTTSEAARLAGVTIGRIRQLLLGGRLKGRHFGRDWQVELQSLREFIASRKTGRPPLDKP
jgi:hypothetical protein